MKSELVAGVIAAVLSVSALGAAQSPPPVPQAVAQAPIAAPAPAVPMLGYTPYVAFGVGDPAGSGVLDPNAPVTRVVTAPPPAATSEDDEVEPADDSPPLENSAYALMLACLAVLLYIASRLRRD